MQADDIKTAVKSFIANQYLDEQSKASLNDDTPMISDGILDSLSTLEVVEFIEQTYSIKVNASDVNIENLDTLNDIAKFVAEKISEKGN